MCCFSRPISFVGATKIFARHAASGRQVLAYAMNVELDSELAMVLPLPVPPRSDEDAVTFVSLAGYERFFDDLASAFPPIFTPAQASRGAPPPPQARTLAVHDVGAFEASFVPTRADFARLDERFRIPDDVWSGFVAYEDWGFAVFKLKPKKGLLGAKRQSIQPMAFSFPTREPRALYFPLLHVHDGHVHDRAELDHALYCQTDGLIEATLDWTRSTGPLGASLDPARTAGLVDGARGGFSQALVGQKPNQDLWLREPEGIRMDDLRGRGACHAYEVNATYAHYFGEWEPALRWTATTRTRLAELCRGLRDGLCELEAAHRADWRLGPLSEDLPPYFMNGDQLWSGTSFMDGARTTRSDAGRIRFSPFSERVPAQSVTLAFDSLPDEAQAKAIAAELSRLVDRAVEG